MCQIFSDEPYYTATFTASSSSTTLQFIGKGPADTLGSFLDDVSIVGADKTLIVTPVQCGPCEGVAAGMASGQTGGDLSAGVGAGGVRQIDGAVSIALTPNGDLQTGGFGTPFGQSSYWTNQGQHATGNTGSSVATSQLPKLLKIDQATIAVSMGSSTWWFDLVDGTYVPRFFYQDKLVHDAGNNEFVLTDTTGTEIRFSDFNASLPVQQRGAFKSITDNAGNLTSVTAYTSDGKIAEVQRTAPLASGTVTESYQYAYVASGASAGLVSSVTLRRRIHSGAWETVRTQEFSYYDGAEAHGNAGDLKTTVVKDAGGQTIDSAYMRYYTLGEAGGYQHGLKYLFRSASFGRISQDFANPFTATDAQLAPYADGYLEYDSQRRVTSLVNQGEGCSACTGGLGTYTYSYSTSTNADGYNSWKYKTVETLPDGNQNITYTNFAGEAMLSIFKDATTSDEWLMFTKYDDAGRVILAANPSAVTGYSESYADLLHAVSGNYEFLADAAGLISTTSYYASTTASSSAPGGVAGYYDSSSLQQGELGASILQDSAQYIEHAVAGVTIYLTASNTVYRNDNGTGAQTISYDYTFFAGTTEIQSISVSLPVISAAQNGSGVAAVSTVYMDVYGRPVWSRDADGFLTYTEYDQATGAVVKMIRDVDTTETSDFTGLPSGWTTPTGGGLHLVTTMRVDSLGRTTKTTDPNGNVTYTVYSDVNHEVRVYAGWNAATDKPTLPITIQRQDRSGGYTETIVLSNTIAPTLSGSDEPTGAETFTAADIVSLSRSYTNAAEQVTHVDSYFSLAGLTYTTATTLGTEGTHFLRTRYKYDQRGRMDRVQDSTGTINRTVYDGLGRVASTWIGTDDTPTTGFWSPTNLAGANMLQTSGFQYDEGGVGDSNLTRERVLAADATFYDTHYEYDFRNRLTDSRGPDGVAGEMTYDNLSQVTRSDVYADLDADFAIDTGELRGRSETAYDEQGRAFESTTYEVDQTTGAIGDSLTSEVWFNQRGFQVKSAGANGLFSKIKYDGAGRAIASYMSFDADETAWSEALTVSGDTVIEQQETIYDAGSRALVNLSFKRLEDDTTTVGALDGGNSYRDASIVWYDLADRMTYTAWVGRDDGGTEYIFDATTGAVIDIDADGLPDVAEGSPLAPNTSDNVIASQIDFDSAGRTYRSTDNLGRITHTDFDLLGRTTRVIRNYVSGTVSETETDSDQTVEYVYDSSGRMAEMIAKNPKGSGNGVEDQSTRYLFESAINASWVTGTIYPDSSDTTSSGTDQVKTTYDRLGRTLTTTDQRGVEHTFVYDTAGRLSADRVTSLGSSGIVDDAVLRIETAYDDMSRVQSITTYDAATSGSVVNQVQYAYNGYGLVSEVFQEHDGAVDGGTPSVKYNYDDGASGGIALFVRLSSVEYPDGREVFYVYPSSGIGDVLSRVEAIAGDAAGTERFAEYGYLGAGTIVSVAHPEVTGGLTLDYNTTGNYEGWDRFGRVVNQEWTNGAGTTTLDHYQYTYDRNSNRTARLNALDAFFSQYYGYDALDRLIDTNQGSPTTDYQNWGLDSLGNWNSFNDDGATQTRNHNAANELTDLSGTTIEPTFDAAGNMTSAARPDDPAEEQTYIYDAWNRLVKVQDDSTTPVTLAEFEFDGRNYRVQKTAGGVVTAYYHNEGHQVLEVREDNVKTKEYVWDLRYIDAPVLRETSSGVLYYTNDANFNITGLVDADTGNVVERYHYDPYGRAKYYNSSWSAPLTQASVYDNDILYTGRELDVETALMHYRARYYDGVLGRFLSRDPLEYLASDMNIYAYVGSSPTNFTDPTGQIRWAKAICVIEKRHKDGATCDFVCSCPAGFFKPTGFASWYVRPCDDPPSPNCIALDAVDVCIVALAVGVAMLDSPAPGPADAAAAGLVGARLGPAFGF